MRTNLALNCTHLLYQINAPICLVHFVVTVKLSCHRKWKIDTDAMFLIHK